MSHLLMQEPQRLLIPVPGELTVRAGCVWLTRHGDLADHLLAAGQRVALGPGDDVVVERWRRDVPTLWDWQPDRVPAGGRYRAAALRVVARGLRAAAGAFAALARNAAAMASRAQGCISAGDSMASSGAVQ
jgi:hypothetical protein